MTLASWSSNSLLIAFILYCAAFLLFVISLTGKRWKNRDPMRHQRKWSGIAFGFSVVGLFCQLLYLVLRWVEGGHIPTSNMFEFMTFLGLTIIAAFTVIYLIYRTPVLGVFAMPIAIVILAYASVFPREVQPLIPALKSYWLYIHVTTAAAGEGFFAVGFAAGFIYLLRTVNYRSRLGKDLREQRGLEFVLLSMLTIVGFVLVTFLFRSLDYQASFMAAPSSTMSADAGQKASVVYDLPPIVAPYRSEIVQITPFLGLSKPLFTAPHWMKGVNAGHKLNTVIWSVVSGLVLYGLLRLLLRRPLGAVFGRLVQGMRAEDLDEISYRAIAIGFPIFTLGGLIFASIWAHEAWGRFWGWDPKETWALITWLFYALYLHLRLSRIWQGKLASWLSVIGFVVVMFTLVGVNLVIAGLHSYAGV